MNKVTCYYVQTSYYQNAKRTTLYKSQQSIEFAGEWYSQCHRGTYAFIKDDIVQSILANKTIEFNNVDDITNKIIYTPATQQKFEWAELQYKMRGHLNGN